MYTLEKLSGNRMTRERLLPVVQRSNVAYDAFHRFLDLRKRARVPISGSHAFYFYYPMYSFLGDQQRTIAFYERLASALTAVEAPEEPPVRLLNVGHYFPLHDRTLVESLEAQGVTFVSEMWALLFSDKAQIDDDSSLQDILVALARRMLTLPTVGSLRRRARVVGDLGREWGVDGAVMFLPWGCRYMSAEAAAKVDHLRSVGIPTLTLDCDPLDPTLYARGTVQTRLDAFVEMLRTRKEGGA